MRILVVSDTHGDAYALQCAVDSQPEAKVVIHLGDGVREAEDTAQLFPDKTFYIVRGNCDWSAGRDYMVSREETFQSKRVFFTHGYSYQVKETLYPVVCAARERKADILLFGHTHQPLTDYEDGLYILNPGSLAYGGGTYGIVDITPGGIAAHIVRCR